MSEEPVEFAELAGMIDGQYSLLMDVNHESMQYAREVVNNLRKIQERFDDAIEDLIEMHISKALCMTRLAEDIILAEFDGSADEDTEGSEGGDESDD